MRLRLLLALLVCAAALMPPQRATALVADVSIHHVAITTGFSGAEVLVFGALERPGDIVVVVRGPAGPRLLHRKSSVGGVWVNTASITFPQVPSFYALASSRPLDRMVSPSELKRLSLGIDQLRPPTLGRTSENLLSDWQQGLVKAMVRQGLYQRAPGRVTLLANTLFRTSISLPPNTPIGNYALDVYVFRDGFAEEAQSLPLVVSKVGIESELYSFAHDYSALYGICAIVVALLAGWMSHLLFRRG